MSMRPFEIRISEAQLQRLEESFGARKEVETAAFLLAGVQRTENRRALLGRRIVEIPGSEYKVRTAHRIELTPRAINGLISLCEAGGLTAILCHSHPHDSSYSPSDDHGEKRIASTLREFTGHEEVGSLLLTPRRLLARVWTKNNRQVPVSKVTIIGNRIRTSWIDGKPNRSRPNDPEIHDRQIRAFAKEGQGLIEGARVGIVGVGGTGSSVAEQLVRLGVKDLILIDKDEFAPSNVSRMYGTFDRHVSPSLFDRLRGQPVKKVEIVRRHLEGISPDVVVRTLASNVANRRAFKILLDRDVVFICTDDHWGRSVLNQIAYQFLIPTINLGVALDSEEGEIRAGNGVVQILRPDTACLWCAEHLDSERIAAESLPHELRKDRIEEGYLRGLEEAAPSVVSLTTTLAGLGVTWFLQLLTGFMGTAGGMTRQNYFMLEGRVRRGRTTQKSECVCQRFLGYGNLKRYPI